MPLMSWFSSIVRRCSTRKERNDRPLTRIADGNASAVQAPLGPGVPAPASRVRPLRVWRVVDASTRAGSPGRLVMAGRLADVCAELDRLAALEAMAA